MAARIRARRYLLVQGLAHVDHPGPPLVQMHPTGNRLSESRVWLFSWSWARMTRVLQRAAGRIFGGRREVGADAGEEAGAEFGQLVLAHALDGEELCLGGGALAGQLAQCGVAEDEVGRDAALLGHGAAEGAEGLEEVGVRRRVRRACALGAAGGAASGLARALCCCFEEAHVCLAPQDAAAVFGERQRGVFALLAGQAALPFELVDPVPDRPAAGAAGRIGWGRCQFRQLA